MHATVKPSSLVVMGVGTEGFEFAGFDREIFNPDTDENGELSPQEVIDFFFDGVATFGERDGLDDIFANGEVVDPIPFGDRPLCAFPLVGFDGTSNGNCFTQETADLFNGGGDDIFGPLVGRTSFAVVVPANTDITLQAGSLDNDFVDWRLRGEYDFTNLTILYLTQLPYLLENPLQSRAVFLRPLSRVMLRRPTTQKL